MGEKLLSAKITKTKLRYDAPQSTFGVRLDIFYPPKSRCLEPKWSFSTPTPDYVNNPAETRESRCFRPERSTRSLGGSPNDAQLAWCQFHEGAAAASSQTAACQCMRDINASHCLNNRAADNADAVLNETAIS